MNVTKTQLKEFIEQKIAARKTAVNEEIKAAIHVFADSHVPNMGEIERAAVRLEELFQPTYDAWKAAYEEADYDMRAVVSLTTLRNRVCQDFEGKVRSYLENPHSGYSQRKIPQHMADKVEALRAELADKLNRYKKELPTLQTELENAIRNENSGKQAYNALVALGVDLSDLPETNPNLPAVTKLSVNVCVLNGGC